MTSVNSSGWGTSSADISQNYLSMLVTQLQNQNPLDPMDTNQMATQLSSLSQLSQIEKMNGQFSKLLHLSQMGQGAGLIGKQVSFLDPVSEQTATATVGEVEVTDEQIYIHAGGQRLTLADLTAIH